MTKPNSHERKQTNTQTNILANQEHNKRTSSQKVSDQETCSEQDDATGEHVNSDALQAELDDLNFEMIGKAAIGRPDSID
jgi:hypothetical protein